ncbi:MULTISPECIES: NAD(P)-dependent oxidoreductase [unclassified Methanoregula]|uniref:NAD-dependent epimerase/dehydratase family protein n=1 Tax=unclassified Methanoregula TaxID=2649730 RepID=UPI0009CB9121|nr:MULTISPECIES: NAD-dependent epimerase/dehydratase family protein [unclassified Methanoregula]OPX63684.1 MAG: UDP-galactose-4-epimerase [Methanoregula sp. PtaB.Bin085]OPY36149.1 MAG: UDP-galactose-4-epimerase [Methanoregula sp. PtaU1.Bin006]
MRVLVTGAAGFTGAYLVKYLRNQNGVEVSGLIRKSSQKNLLRDTPCIVADLLDREKLAAAVRDVCPDTVIHLGGMTRGDYGELLRANVIGTKNILDAGTAANPDCRFLVVSSSAVYGYAGEAPIAESAPLQPLSEYGISKVAQEAQALMHYKREGTAVSLARPFNLAGPGQPESFICGKLVHQLAAAGKKQPVLDLWETSSSRDLIDVRDVVRGCWVLASRPDFAEQCSGKAFNLGSGNAYPVSSIITMLEEITQRQLTIHLPEKIAVPPIPSQKSDNTRITSLTGWRPEFPLKQTLRDMLEAAGVKTNG